MEHHRHPRNAPDQADRQAEAAKCDAVFLADGVGTRSTHQDLVTSSGANEAKNSTTTSTWSTHCTTSARPSSTIW